MVLYQFKRQIKNTQGGWENESIYWFIYMMVTSQLSGISGSGRGSDSGRRKSERAGNCKEDKANNLKGAKLWTGELKRRFRYGKSLI